MKKLVLAVATGLGTGYSPVASGTVGSALAFVLYWLFCPVSVAPLAAVLLTALSVYAAGEAEKIFNSRDDSRIVIDEIAGYFVSVAFMPKTLFLAVGAFIFFRLFDVVKPLFIDRVQDWRGGWGVTFDDIFAGILANLVMQVIRHVLF